MILVLSVQAYATTLTVLGSDNLGHQLIYDSALNVTWLDYTNPANTWQNQVNWASSLEVNFNGTTLTGWRLPSTVDADPPYSGNPYDGTGTYGFNITNPGDEMSYLYYAELGNKGYYDTSGNLQPGYGLVNKGPFRNLVYSGYGNSLYWSGTATSADPYLAWDFNFGDGAQYDYDKDGYYSYFYGVAVRPGDAAEPTSVPEPDTILLLGAGLTGLMLFRKRFVKL